jgi:hypothetical protein
MRDMEGEETICGARPARQLRDINCSERLTCWRPGLWYSSVQRQAFGRWLVHKGSDLLCGLIHWWCNGRCVGPKTSAQPRWPGCLAREWVGVLDSCLTKPKDELHGQRRVSIEIGKFLKGKNESACGEGGVLSGLPEKWCDLWFLFIFSSVVLLNLYANWLCRSSI